MLAGVLSTPQNWLGNEFCRCVEDTCMYAGVFEASDGGLVFFGQIVDDALLYCKKTGFA